MVGALASILGAIIPPLVSYFTSNKGEGLKSAANTAKYSVPLGVAGYNASQELGSGKGGPLTGIPGQSQTTPNFEPDQLDFLKKLLQSLGNVSPTTARADFGPIADQEIQRFYSDTIPSLAERFSSLGTGGSQRSSGFAQAIGQAGNQLGTNLAAQKSKFGLQQQALDQNHLSTLLGLAFQPRNSNQYFQGQPGLLQGAVGGLSQGVGQQIGKSLFQ